MRRVLGQDVQSHVYDDFIKAKNGDVEDLIEFLDQRALKHDHLYHYTNYCAAKNILTSKELWLSPLNNVNDKQEANMDQRDKKVSFLFSMCSDQDENLSMWYLYSGKNGVRVSLTPQSFVNNDRQFYLYNKKNQRCILLSNDKTEIFFSDILYAKEYYSEKTQVRIIYEGCDVLDYPKDKYLILKKNRGRLIKAPIWKNEHETRWIVNVETRELDIFDFSDWVVKTDVSDAIRKSQVVFHPECKNPVPINGYDAVYSEYGGKIQMRQT